MPGHTHPKWYQLEEIFNIDIAQILQTCYFGYFGNAWLNTLKVMLSTCRKLLCLSAGSKSTSSSTFFWRYCKDMQTSYFGHFGHAWLCTPTVILSTLQQLSLKLFWFLCYYSEQVYADWLEVYCILKVMKRIDKN